MLIYPSLILFCWLAFVVVWVLSSFTAKRTVRSKWWQNYSFRIVLIVIIIALIHVIDVPLTQNFGSYGLISSNPVVLSIGVFLCALGIALAIWARIYLGSNWGMPMSLKENPELVTTGPYAYIRHPIYAGVILAAIGTTITIGTVWLVPLAVYCGYFLYSAPKEEKNMTREFPDAYPAYKKRTKMLIPFIF